MTTSTQSSASKATAKESHWLDKYIVEQADHYGMTVEAKARLFNGAAECAELIETGEIDEPAFEKEACTA